MRFCTFRGRREGRDAGRLGIVEGGKVFEAKGAADLLRLLESGSGRGVIADRERGSYPISEVALGPPVPRPGKIVAAIVNTQGMLGGEDVGLDRPRLDMKAPSAVIGPGEEIESPLSGIRPEVELAAVLGERISRATPAQARKAIFGYTVLNDVTAPKDSKDDAYEAYRRDKETGKIRKATMRGPLFRSKNHDTFCPMGPYLVSRDEIRDVRSLRMTTKFEGTLVQDGSTSEYIFKPWEIAAYVSGFLSLEPGDVVSCGSVGWTREALGMLDPTEFVLPVRTGTLELEIEGLGVLSNPVRPRGGGRGPQT